MSLNKYYFNYCIVFLIIVALLVKGVLIGLNSGWGLTLMLSGYSLLVHVLVNLYAEKRENKKKYTTLFSHLVLYVFLSLLMGICTVYLPISLVAEHPFLSYIVWLISAIFYVFISPIFISYLFHKLGVIEAIAENKRNEASSSRIVIWSLLLAMIIITKYFKVFHIDINAYFASVYECITAFVAIDRLDKELEKRFISKK